jgi:parallel beta-helix repeat protein
LLVALALLAAAGPAPAALCGGSTRCECGDTVSVDTVLSYDIGVCGTTGLEVASGVTLDCDGHSITGNDESNAKYGVYLDEVTGAEVRNCRVAGFRRGLRISGGSGNVLFKNRTYTKVDGVVLGNKYGIDLASTSANVVKGNAVRHSRDEGIHAGSADENRIIGNRISHNKRENLYLLNSHRNLVTRNLVHHGKASAIYVKHSRDNTFVRNEVRDSALSLRGDSSGNVFENNYLKGEGYIFEAHLEGEAWTYPHGNTMSDDCIRKTDTCYRFFGAFDNVATGSRTDSRCMPPTGALVTEEERGGLTPTGNVVERTAACNDSPF